MSIPLSNSKNPPGYLLIPAELIIIYKMHYIVRRTSNNAAYLLQCEKCNILALFERI